MSAQLSDLKARIAKMKGAPLGTIPPSELKAASERVLSDPGRMEELCYLLFPKGRTSARGDYWEVPEIWIHQQRGEEIAYYQYALRISFNTGGCWDLNHREQGIIPGSNPLFLLLISEGALFQERKGVWQCSDAKALKKAVKDLNSFCDLEDEKAESGSKAEEDSKRPREIADLIRELLLNSGEIKRKSAKQIWDLLNRNSNGAILGLPELASHYLLFDLLKKWAEEDEAWKEEREKGLAKTEYFVVSPEGSRKKVLKFSLIFNDIVNDSERVEITPRQN
jgi:hypothetical protein